MKKPRNRKPASHADGGTTRPETPELEGRTPLPEELTGKASGTDADLISLFDGERGEHIADGFRSGSGDDAANASDASGARLKSTGRTPE
jgi:hypothetical protein